MKKNIVMLAALVLGLSTAAQAQYRGRGGNVSLGVKAGASLTNFVGNDAKDAFNRDFTYRFGFNAGVFANIGFARLFAFQPELLYSQKGAKFDGSSDAGFRLHYIDVPLAFHVNTDGFFFEAGPQVGFLVAAKSQTGSVSVDIKDAYKTVDVGYLAGLGYQLKHGPGVGLRYNGEFTNFPKSTTTGSVTVQPRVRNSTFQLYVTYSFN
ncbi:outer membrane beta-barrel protein [Hymenobacter sp. HMF4947]|uniref:Outer membrane beta-barrel protein n=1 Tax=Hymenobacter ginkgonis TaxID=2682976 RepID=A0A7K1THP3_9BACT|nr:porin family protein [Hymenobacter ginkgonis]MVN77883.1 outer membrane beta-barrel protein [Hymenobacter ginkgonis]